MSKIWVLPFWDKKLPENSHVIINTTTKSKNWSRGLSPMLVGQIYSDNGIALNMENFWQYAKVYQHQVDENGEPKPEYFNWKNKGYNKQFADRYPAGKGAIPLYTWYCGEKLDYIDARKRLYVKYYGEAVVKTEAFKQLKEVWLNCLRNNQDLVLQDFDAYNHRILNYSWDNILHDESRKMGHAFVLAKLLSEIKL
tara:strand:+ start:310 stop:897 length:588 start_codon:yes stop_codon:yes gene_type:complete